MPVSFPPYNTNTLVLIYVLPSLSDQFFLMVSDLITPSYLQIYFIQIQIDCSKQKILISLPSQENRGNQQSIFSDTTPKINNYLHPFSSQERNITSLNQNKSDLTTNTLDSLVNAHLHRNIAQCASLFL